ncbi:glycosyltransferase family protein [Mucilaginibacter pedocola]|uniref:Glycosyltransferase subfamily 4-like N-terminal domain-containing protein n=1 Tax=Mucilaginibacter pedocola TaxID=1792845 RepID=A0A1S9P7Z1_9SPHI|nr:glycosyltransferase family 1 protein [Mucilaginibacter pedocola]OOQ57071.1 hypothetical protein BC343_16195 [Mucilaginibacter pedocola]
MIEGNLNIVFVCSSVEPGHDGVGDYTRRLAAALIQAGNQCAILSLNDRQVQSPVATTQQADGADVPVMRLPASMPFEQRMAKAEWWVGAINPQWLSLQFVPFGYHSRGLKIGLSKLLSPLGKGRRWHIMFHELWVGIATEETKKLHWWGAAQRMLIKSLIKNLKPAVIHTHTALYQTLLAQLGYTAQYLPLFGNIPVVTNPKDGSLPQYKLDFVVFGSIHDRAPIDEFAAEAAAYAKKKNIPVTLTIIGRGNAEQQRWATAWQNAGLTVAILGELPAEEVSAVFSKADIGLSATALAVIGKSGSYAAMREHGLPVISVSKSWTPRGVAKPEIPHGVAEYVPGKFEECVANSKFGGYGVDVDSAAATFAQALNSI